MSLFGTLTWKCSTVSFAGHSTAVSRSCPIAAPHDNVAGVLTKGARVASMQAPQSQAGPKDRSWSCPLPTSGRYHVLVSLWKTPEIWELKAVAVVCEVTAVADLELGSYLAA